VSKACSPNPVLRSGVPTGTVGANPCTQKLKNVLFLFVLMCIDTYLCSETRTVYVPMHKHTVHSSTGPVQP